MKANDALTNRQPVHNSVTGIAKRPIDLRREGRSSSASEDITPSRARANHFVTRHPQPLKERIEDRRLQMARSVILNSSLVATMVESQPNVFDAFKFAHKMHTEDSDAEPNELESDDEDHSHFDLQSVDEDRWRSLQKMKILENEAVERKKNEKKERAKEKKPQQHTEKRNNYWKRRGKRNRSMQGKRMQRERQELERMKMKLWR
ncbi:hypothetical protein PoB_001777400 [Plakobranchus ocellatus]|uniref:Uncharacterized protein n=1 Tax=Plakobranchus ocellatus TaxID=259542 RepID=A0AAV3ZBE2_9GAST|nr:hypothetical protein PoB_001777400 [Plakobranchus ocellatus]